jgi:hypothetical protein
MQPGVEAFSARTADNILLVRGPAGMLEGAWEGDPVEAAPQGLQPVLADLNALLEETAELEPAAEEEVETTATPTATSTTTATATATPTVTATAAP